MWCVWCVCGGCLAAASPIPSSCGWTARASDFFYFIFFTVWSTAAPFLGHVLVTASVVGLRSGEYRKEASLYVDGQGPGLHLLHPLHRVAHGGSFSWTSSGNRKRRRLRSGEYRKEATAAVGTRRTWAFRGGPGPSLIWKVGADLPEPHNSFVKVTSAQQS